MDQMSVIHAASVGVECSLYLALCVLYITLYPAVMCWTVGLWDFGIVVFWYFGMVVYPPSGSSEIWVCEIY